MVSGDKEMCELLNTFEEIRVFQVDCDEMLADIMVKKDIVAKKLEKLKLNKAARLDDCAPRLLIETAMVLSRHSEIYSISH